MALRSPIFLIIGAVVLVILILLRFGKRKYKKNSGKLVANTKYVKKLSYYKELVNKYKLLISLLKVTCLIAIFFCFVSFSRPHTKDVVNVKQYSRDIFLCMDVSGSVNHLNKQMVDDMKETVKGLNGERFGISIFNSTSIMISPLSDDYNFILSSLDNISESISAINSYGFGSSYSTYEYIIAGTQENYQEIGSSLIGDGLASCVLDFPKVEEEKDRTRIIIFTTDNELYSKGEPLFTLSEAAELAKKKNIVVFGVATKNTTSRNFLEFEAAVKLSGGKIYKEGEVNTVKDIIKDIESTSKTLTVVDERKITMDEPFIPFVIVLVATMSLFALDRRLRNGN